MIYLRQVYKKAFVSLEEVKRLQLFFVEAQRFVAAVYLIFRMNEHIALQRLEVVDILIVDEDYILVMISADYVQRIFQSL